MVKLSIEEIADIIRPCGLSPMKSKGIHGLSQILIDKYKGKVPKSFEALEALPAVGHKTASVVMSQAFKVPAFPVDTHIHRLLTRWELLQEHPSSKLKKMQKHCSLKNSGINFTFKLFFTAANIHPHVSKTKRRLHHTRIRKQSST